MVRTELFVGGRRRRSGCDVERVGGKVEGMVVFICRWGRVRLFRGGGVPQESAQGEGDEAGEKADLGMTMW